MRIHSSLLSPLRASLAALAGLLASSDAGAQSKPPLPADTLPANIFPAGDPPVGPAGLGLAPRAVTNPLTEAAFDLGRKLFFDPILSVDRTVSCASCHQPEHGLASPEPQPLGANGNRTRWTAPTVYNRGYAQPQGWDGASAGIEMRVTVSIEHPDEMGLPMAEAAARIHEHPEYRPIFDRLYRTGPSETSIARALGSFVRGLLLGGSVVDHYRLGKLDALTQTELAGMWLFEGKAGCWQCHNGRNFSDEHFHNTGVGVVDGVPEDGRFNVTKRDHDRGRFKTPTLRGLTATAPYMHDGSLATLEDVVDFYMAGGNANPGLDVRIEPLVLTDNERTALLAYLRALSRRYR